MGKNGFAFIFILFLVLILGIVGGGGYYYLGVYQPAQYAKQIIEFYDQTQTSAQILFQSDLKERDDYIGTLAILQKRKEFLSQSRTRLTKLSPPLFGEGRQLHKDFLVLIDSFSEAVDDAEKRAHFFARAVELRDVFEPETLPPQPITMRDLQSFYEQLIPKAKKTGSELFQIEPPKLHEVSFEELKTAWQKTEPSLDTLLQFIRSLDPNAPFDPSALNQLQTEQVKEAGDELTSFGKLLEAAIDNNSAYDILSYRFFSGASQEKMQNTQNIDQAITKLRQKYGAD